MLKNKILKFSSFRIFCYICKQLNNLLIMECPYCNDELNCIDYYGKKQFAQHYYIYPQSWIEKEGDIFICKNEECDCYEQHFYTDKQNNLHEGYPC